MEGTRGDEFYNKSERELRSTAGVENVSPFHPLVNSSLPPVRILLFILLYLSSTYTHTPSWILVIINAVALYRFFLRVQTFFFLSSVPFASAANLKQKKSLSVCTNTVFFQNFISSYILIISFHWLVKFDSSFNARNYYVRNEVWNWPLSETRRCVTFSDDGRDILWQS